MDRTRAIDLFIEKNEDGMFTRVMDSPAGTAAAVFHYPLSTVEIEAFARAASSPYQPDPLQFESARRASQAMGTRLFDATFAGEVGAVFHRCMEMAYEQATRIRVRLRLTPVHELVRLPWETLYNHMRREYMALSPHAPLFRYVELSHAIRPLRVTAPLRMLVVIAGPPGYPPVEVDREWLALIDTLDILGARREMLVERVVHPTLFELQRRLRQQTYHILHFVGHSVFNTQAQEAFIVLEDEQRRGRLVSGAHLGSLLREHDSLRLVSLNSCGAWQPIPCDPFVHAAYSLVRAGLPATIAVPYELTDRSALAFCFDLYSRLATGEAADVATAEARRTMLSDVAGVEWSAPVLVSRVPDGVIFEIGQGALQAEQSAHSQAINRYSGRYGGQDSAR
jgi:hypothetical protein